MARNLKLRFTQVTTSNGNYWDSNLIVIHDTSGVHLDMGVVDNDVTIFQSITGTNFVTIKQDYFGETWDKIFTFPGIGQVVKLRLNHLPDNGQVLGNIEDGGDVNPDDPNDILNAFGGKDGMYFLGKDSEYFVGRTC